MVQLYRKESGYQATSSSPHLRSCYRPRRTAERVEPRDLIFPFCWLQGILPRRIVAGRLSVSRRDGPREARHWNWIIEERVSFRLTIRREIKYQRIFKERRGQVSFLCIQCFQDKIKKHWHCFDRKTKLKFRIKIISGSKFQGLTTTGPRVYLCISYFQARLVNDEV